MRLAASSSCQRCTEKLEDFPSSSSSSRYEFLLVFSVQFYDNSVMADHGKGRFQMIPWGRWERQTNFMYVEIHTFKVSFSDFARRSQRIGNA